MGGPAALQCHLRCTAWALDPARRSSTASSPAAPHPLAPGPRAPPPPHTHTQRPPPCRHPGRAADPPRLGLGGGRRSRAQRRRPAAGLMTCERAGGRAVSPLSALGGVCRAGATPVSGRGRGSGGGAAVPSHGQALDQSHCRCGWGRRRIGAGAGPASPRAAFLPAGRRLGNRRAVRACAPPRRAAQGRDAGAAHPRPRPSPRRDALEPPAQPAARGAPRRQHSTQTPAT